MRLLLWLTGLFAALYSGYWFVGSRAYLSAAETALVQMQAKGMADFDGLSVRGFPSRFDLTLASPRLTSRDGQTEWSAAFVQVFALSYRPNRLIAVLPHEQTLRLGHRTLAITSADMRASVALGAQFDLPLDHAELAADELAVGTTPDWTARAERAVLASRQAGGTSSHQVALVLTNLSLAPGLRAALDPATRHPATLPRVALDAVATFDQPIDRALAETGPRLTGLQAISANAEWGTMKLDATGEVAIGPGGSAEGRIEVKARDWRRMLALMTDTGILSQDQAETLERGFMALALAAGDMDLLTIPVTFRDGLTYVGPFPMGPAPRL